MPSIPVSKSLINDSQHSSGKLDINAPDFVKGVAIIWVMAFHLCKDFTNFFCPAQKDGLSFAHIALSGSLAVDLFVITSGFLLMRAYQPRGELRIWLKGFLIKRFLRIFPLYYVCLAGVLFLDYLIGRSNFHISAESLILHLVGAHTFSRFIFDIQGAWWFVGLIVQLYLCFPILVIAVGDNRRASKDLSTLVALLALAIAARFFPHLNLDGNYSVFAFLPDFCLGILIAKYCGADMRIQKPWLLSGMALISLTVVLYAFSSNIFVFDHWYGLFRPLIAICIFFLLISAFWLFMHLNRNISLGICMFGIYSYPIYLLHRPIIYKFVTISSVYLPPPMIILFFVLFLFPIGVALQKAENFIMAKIVPLERLKWSQYSQSHS